MNPAGKFHKKHKINKKFISKNKNLKLYKEKPRKIDYFKKEVKTLSEQYNKTDFNSLESFVDYPITSKTLRGLTEANYTKPTDIQKETIGLALKKHDILGAAQTGSGKTLAFLIPILERLYCLGWSLFDGLGALIITPTRELAYQIYQVLQKVGCYHRYSVGLVTGGKDLKTEWNRVNKCNILICTPGRLLQHMDENALFDTLNLKLLVLDEADRLLDLGFERTMNAIIENLPAERQTMLFSATQTKSVKDLARLSLKNPMYVSVHEYATYATPTGLKQKYMVCEAQDKMNMLWSFIKKHKQQKILVFMASCKQVKYVHDSFIHRHIRPGVSIMALHGDLHQMKRMEVYDSFCRKNHVVLFATDIASRGLDFPNVNYVLQLDCPEDVSQYIHRAGRTARYEKGGKSLLVVLPSEVSIIEQLHSKKVPIKKQHKQQHEIGIGIEQKLQANVARDPKLSESCKRAFKAYLKNIYFMKDKSVFDVTKIDFEAYAKSLGLRSAPRIRFLEKHLKLKTAGPSVGTKEASHHYDSDCDDADAMVFSEKPDLLQNDQNQSDSEPEEPTMSKKPVSKAALAKRILKRNALPNTIVKFDDDSKPLREVCGQTLPDVALEIKNELLEKGYSKEKAKLLLQQEDEVDKMIYKERVKSKHKKERLKLKEQNVEKSGNEPAVLKKDESDEEREQSDVDPNNLSESNSEGEEDSPHGSEEESSAEDEATPHHSEEETSEETIHQIPSSVKRKTAAAENASKKPRLSAKHETGSSRTLEDDEELALRFLSNT